MAGLSTLLRAARRSPEYYRAKRLVQNDLSFLRTLVTLRKRSGLEQRDVASRLGISQQAVSKIERLEGDPKLSTLRRYANAIGVIVEHSAYPDDGTAYSLHTPVGHRGQDRPPIRVSPMQDVSPYRPGVLNSVRTDFALSA